MRRAQEREVTQQRFTTLDRELERRRPDHVVEVRTRAPSGRIDESLLIARLEHLEGLRLAERISRTSWRLVEGWQKRLRDHGSRGDILQQIHAAVRGDPSRYDAIRPGEALPPEPGEAAPVVTGRVAGKGLSDELNVLRSGRDARGARVPRPARRTQRADPHGGRLRIARDATRGANSSSRPADCRCGSISRGHRRARPDGR